MSIAVGRFHIRIERMDLPAKNAAAKWDRVLLVDNGSLRPEATLNLRRLAAELSAMVGREVEPVSLLHAYKIPADELGGTPATSLAGYTKRLLAAGTATRFLVLPLFFGPSRALTDYAPRRMGELQAEFPQLEFAIAPTLVKPDDSGAPELAGLLADAIVEKAEAAGLEDASVVMVDHGTPEPTVNAVRRLIAGELRKRLAARGAVRVAAFTDASMERRPEPEYAFNDPLLEHALRADGFRGSRVIVSMLFLNPGRHAGDGGDVAQICAAAEAEDAMLQTHRAALLGEGSGLLPLLAERYRDAVEREEYSCHLEAR